jgi:hypothetical protein
MNQKTGKGYGGDDACVVLLPPLTFTYNVPVSG